MNLWQKSLENSSEFSSENIFANLGLFPYAAFELGKKSNFVMALGAISQGRISSIVDSTTYDSAATSTLFDIGGLTTIGWATRTESLQCCSAASSYQKIQL